jgi:hypothetical protein
MLDMWCHVITYEGMSIPFSPLRLDSSIEIKRMIICHVIFIVGGAIIEVNSILFCGEVKVCGQAEWNYISWLIQQI